MFSQCKKWLVVLVALLFLLTFAGGCAGNSDVSGDNQANAEAETPILNMAWDFDLHGSILLAAVVKARNYRYGYYLKERSIKAI